MPRGFSTHAAGPMRTAGGFAAPVDEVANATLRARAATTNTERFTAEHMAAYHAFASVTDRKDALALHQGFVTWDDVNEYGAAGMPFTNYRLMVEIRRNGVTPAVLRTWKAVHSNLPYSAIGVFTKAGLTTNQAAPYFLRDGDAAPAVAPVDLDKIPELISRGITATDAHQYRNAGIARATDMLVLHRAGCRPHIVVAHRANLSRTPSTTAFPKDFTAYYRNMDQWVGSNTALVHALVTVNATVADGQAWMAAGVPVDRVGLLVLAGVSPTEYLDAPYLAENPETLAAMAALRGHAVAVPALSADALTLVA